MKVFFKKADRSLCMKNLLTIMAFLFVFGSPSTGFTQAIDPQKPPQRPSDCRKSRADYQSCVSLAIIVVNERYVREAIESLAQRSSHLSHVMNNVKDFCLECEEYINLNGLSQRNTDLSNAISDIKRKFSSNNN